MNLRSSALFATCIILLVGCSPKKAPKPNVTVDANAAFAAASDGVAMPSAKATAADDKSDANSGTLPVIGPAPAWKLRDISGKEITSDDFKGKVIVLDFWATWCPPCRGEIPGYVDLYRKYGKDRLAIIGVSVDEGGPKVVEAFAKKFAINYPIVMADDAVQSAYGGLEAIPTTFLIDRNGQIRDKKVGADPTEEYEKKIKALLD